MWQEIRENLIVIGTAGQKRAVEEFAPTIRDSELIILERVDVGCMEEIAQGQKQW